MRLIDADRIDRNQVTVYDYKDQKWVHIFEIPTEDAVSSETYQQTIWERDVALAQLNEIGKGFGEVMDDVATVVRCRDCVHCADDWNGNQPQFTCELGRCGEAVYPNDYCSWGERKENAEFD